MCQQGAIPPSAVLQLIGCLHGSFLVVRVLLGVSAGCRVDLFQLGDGKRRLFRVFPFICLIEINQLRLSLVQLGDDQAHLQPPVAQMHIADHRMAHITPYPLDTLADDGRTQMSHMQRLCHIGTAIVDHDGLGMCRRLQTKLLAGAHFIQIIADKSLLHFQVQESRCHCIHLRKHVLCLQDGSHVPGDHDGRFVVLLGSRQCAVALIFTQIGAVGHRHLSIFFFVSGLHKRRRHLFRNQIQYLLHLSDSLLMVFVTVHERSSLLLITRRAIRLFME